MYQTAHQLKQESLMRVAQSRLAAVESLECARAGVASRLEKLPSFASIARYTALAGGGMVVARLMLKNRRGAVAAATAARTVNPWMGVAAQAVSMLVLPAVQKWMMGEKLTLPSLPSMPRLPELPQVPTPTELFFRWLGLQK